MSEISPVAVLYDSSGNAVSIVNDSSVYRVSGLSKVLDSGGSQIDPATKENQESTIDSGNSTTSQLAADAVFTGTGIDVVGYATVTLLIHSDYDSADDGVEVQFSSDNTNWDYIEYYTLDTTLVTTVRLDVPIVARYFRLKYTNGDTLTTELRIQTLLHRSPIQPSRVKSGSTVQSDQNGLIIGTETDEGFVRWLQSSTAGRLRVVTDSQADGPLHVISSTGRRSYYHRNLVDADEPAEIDTGVDEPYDVGGDTLTIDINGTTQYATFATRAAQPGIHYSAAHPDTSNPDVEKLKVSVDGGALEEIKTGKGLTTGAAIAASLQAQIRANIENGTNVTVEYNTAEYPFRYVFKSGTTGSTSIMHVEKGGDDLAKRLLVGAFGGTEYTGLNADNYWAFEVVDEMVSDLTDVVVNQAGDGVHVQTVAGGASATLEVTAGGANTALQFPTTEVTGVAGSGSDDMGVDGSSSSVRYSIVPESGEEFVVAKIEFFVRDDGAALNKFGGQAQLTNGVKLEIKNELLTVIPTMTMKTNADLMTQLDEGTLVDNGFTSGGQDLVKAEFDLSPGLRVIQGGQTNVYVTIQDDLSALDGTFTVRARGWVEAPE